MAVWLTSGWSWVTCNGTISVRNCAFRLLGVVKSIHNKRITGDRTSLGKSSPGRALARYTALVTQCQRYGDVVSLQPGSRSARTLKDLEPSCLLYCRLNPVVQSSMVTQILYSTCLLICAHGAITMAGKLYGLQQNKQLSQVLSLPTSEKEIAKRSDLPFKISSSKLLEI